MGDSTEDLRQLEVACDRVESSGAALRQPHLLGWKGFSSAVQSAVGRRYRAYCGPKELAEDSSSSHSVARLSPPDHAPCAQSSTLKEAHQTAG
ncbi:unnamed protein product [Lota lota]